MTPNRPSHVKCVVRGYENGSLESELSWCGRRVCFRNDKTAYNPPNYLEFVFTNATHALLHANAPRADLEICGECAKAMIELIERIRYRP